MQKLTTMLTLNYVTTRLQGRIGSQMFQIANAYAQSLKHNRQLVLPVWDAPVEEYFSNVYRKLDFFLDGSQVRIETNGMAGKRTDVKTWVHNKDVHLVEHGFEYSALTPHESKPTTFVGYYRSEKYFKEHSQNVKTLFGPTKEFVEQALIDYPQLKAGTVAAINIRRGDFLLHPTMCPVFSVEYINKAVEMLPSTDAIIVISDDIPWCKDNLKHLPNLVFSDYTTWKALWLLSLCDHFVIANSCFSWWGAYLSQSPNKVVITPELWYGPSPARTFSTEDIHCEGWRIVPCSYKEGTIVPK